MSQLDLVTGAFGYTGRYLTRRLEADGHRVRTLTNHPQPSDTVEALPYSFDDRPALVKAFTGVTVFYNTYARPSSSATRTSW